MENKKGFAHILLVVVILGIIGAVGYLVYKSSETNSSNEAIQNPINTNNTAGDIVAPTPSFPDWKVYINEVSGFFIQAPPDWKVELSSTKDPLTSLTSPDSAARITISRGSKLPSNSTLENYYLEPTRYLNHGEYTVLINTSGEFKVQDKTYGEAPPGGNERVISFMLSPDGYVYLAAKEGAKFSLELFNQILSTFEFIDPKKSTLHSACTQDSDCPDNSQCVSFYGFAGNELKSCEIECSKNEDCPTDYFCGSLSDGPQNVCIPYSI